jgi:hypothetical protein
MPSETLRERRSRHPASGAAANDDDRSNTRISHYLRAMTKKGRAA